MLTSISVTARSTDRSVRAAWRAHLAGGGIGRTSWTMKPFQGHFYSASGSPKTLLGAQFWFLAADDVLPTFCQGGGCQPSTSQMKQPRGAGANVHTEQPGLVEGPTSPPWATWLQKHQILAGGFNLWFLKVKKTLWHFKPVFQTYQARLEFKFTRRSKNPFAKKLSLSHC